MTDFSDTELTAVNQLIERQRQELIEDTNDQLEQQIRRVIEEVNWSNVEVVDIVHVTRTHKHSGFDGDVGFTRSHGIQWHAYDSRGTAPDSDTAYSSVGDHHKQVYRITEYLCHEIGIDPVTGINKDD